MNSAALEQAGWASAHPATPASLVRLVQNHVKASRTSPVFRVTALARPRGSFLLRGDRAAVSSGTKQYSLAHTSDPCANTCTSCLDAGTALGRGDADANSGSLGDRKSASPASGSPGNLLTAQAHVVRKHPLVSGELRKSLSGYPCVCFFPFWPPCRMGVPRPGIRSELQL